MIIVGAKGFAKEVLEVCHQNDELKDLVFFDDISNNVEDKLFNRFKVLKSLDEAKEYFESVDNRFTLGIGTPKFRLKLYEKFSRIGGVLTSTISTSSIIGHYGNSIKNGVNIMQKVVLTNNIKVGKGALINQFSSIGHDAIIGEFVEICPSVSISGNCKIGALSFIGTNSVIHPDICIGENVSIGSGAVVTNDIPDNCTAVGIPAKIINKT